jgi:hypothetical protein
VLTRAACAGAAGSSERDETTAKRTVLPRRESGPPRAGSERRTKKDENENTIASVVLPAAEPSPVRKAETSCFASSSRDEFAFFSVCVNVSA